MTVWCNNKSYKKKIILNSSRQPLRGVGFIRVELVKVGCQFQSTSWQQQRKVGCLSFNVSMYNSWPFCLFLSLVLRWQIKIYYFVSQQRCRFAHCEKCDSYLYSSISLVPPYVPRGVVALFSSFWSRGVTIVRHCVNRLQLKTFNLS